MISLPIEKLHPVLFSLRTSLMSVFLLIDIDNNFILPSEINKMIVCQNFCGSTVLCMKPCHPKFSQEIEAIDAIPVLGKASNLPVPLWEKETLQCNSTHLGKFLSHNSIPEDGTGYLRWNLCINGYQKRASSKASHKLG